MAHRKSIKAQNHYCKFVKENDYCPICKKGNGPAIQSSKSVPYASDAKIKEEKPFNEKERSGIVLEGKSCSFCYAVPTKRLYCKACKQYQMKFVYCDKKCQMGDWKYHKAECVNRAIADIDSELKIALTLSSLTLSNS